MSKVLVINHLTLDGVMQAPGHPDEDRRDGFEHGGWAQPAHDPVMQTLMGQHMGESWSLLAGRHTYERFAAYWPHQPEPNPFGHALTKAQKYVASTTLTEPLPWANSTLLQGDLAEAVTALKELGNTLVVFGSGNLVRSLIRHDLVDEYLLLIHPRVLGSGRRLFTDDGPPAQLRLVDSQTTSTGVIIATYRPQSRE
jgi:dihydrofolate reductase